MTLKVAIQMDPVHSIIPDKDSTLLLATEALHRGYKLYHYQANALTLYGGEVTVRGHHLTIEHGAKLKLGKQEVLNLANMNVILMRQDPPFDMSYITATYMLEHIHPDTLVVNDPISVRNSPEKIFSMGMEGLMPPTIITCDVDEIITFREEHHDIVIKPLYGNGGAGVFHITEEDENFYALIELYTSMYKEQIVVQSYLPSIREGDKRIIVIDGSPAGAILRVPKKGDSRSNLHAGGIAKKANLDKRDNEICNLIGPTLRKNGIIFAGIDVIGGYLTETNVTSPTGIQEINYYDKVSLEKRIWDAIEQKLNAQQAA